MASTVILTRKNRRSKSSDALLNKKRMFGGFILLVVLIFLYVVFITMSEWMWLIVVISSASSSSTTHNSTSSISHRTTVKTAAGARRTTIAPRCNPGSNNGKWVSVKKSPAAAAAAAAANENVSEPQQYLLGETKADENDANNNTNISSSSSSCTYKYLSGSHLVGCLPPAYKIQIWGDSTSRQMASSLMCYIQGQQPRISDHSTDGKPILKGVPSFIDVERPSMCFRHNSEFKIRKCIMERRKHENYHLFNECVFDHLSFDWHSPHNNNVIVSYEWMGDSAQFINRYHRSVVNKSKNGEYQAPDLLLLNTGLHIEGTNASHLENDIAETLRAMLNDNRLSKTKIVWLESNVVPPKTRRAFLDDSRREVGIHVAKSLGVPIIRTSHLLLTASTFDTETDIHQNEQNEHRAQLVLNTMAPDSCFSE